MKFQYAAWLPALMCLLSATSAAASDARNVVLHADGGVKVFGTFTAARPDNSKVILLFHQAHANRHEYDAVVPTLTDLGYDTLAIDQRAGGKLFGGDNRTVAELGKSAGYLEALADLEAALAWARQRGYKTIVTVGSSYSASLNILLAARHPGEITALASFSPGEYFDDKNLIKNAAAKVKIPFYITTDPAEEGNVTEVLSKTRGNADNIVRYQPAHGVHGASTLVESRDPAGYRENLHHFTAFLSWVGSRKRS